MAIFRITGKHTNKETGDIADIDFVGDVISKDTPDHFTTTVVSISYSGRANDPLFRGLGRDSHIFDGSSIDDVMNKIKDFCKQYKIKFERK